MSPFPRDSSWEPRDPPHGKGIAVRKPWRGLVSAAGRVAILLGLLVEAGPASATMFALGTIASGEFTYLGGSS